MMREWNILEIDDAEIAIDGNFYGARFEYLYTEDIDRSYGAKDEWGGGVVKIFINEQKLTNVEIQCFGKNFERWIPLEKLRLPNQGRVEEAIYEYLKGQRW